MAVSLAIVSAALLATTWQTGAEEWWWIGLNGDQPHRVVTYIDRASVTNADPSNTRVTTLGIAETALPTGQQRQRTLYYVDCPRRVMAVVEAHALTANGSEMSPLPTPQPLPAPVASGSIGEAILMFACQGPQQGNAQVSDASRHASQLLGSQASQRDVSMQQRGGADGGPIHLICGGGGVDRGTAVGTAQIWSDGMPTTVVSQRPTAEEYSDQVNVELTGETGRIRLPRSILPTIRGGADQDGYWRLRDIRYSQNEITARLLLNFMNQPRVRIDRLTGRLHISGRSGTFDGFCEAYDPATIQRRF